MLTKVWVHPPQNTPLTRKPPDIPCRAVFLFVVVFGVRMPSPRGEGAECNEADEVLPEAFLFLTLMLCDAASVRLFCLQLFANYFTL